MSMSRILPEFDREVATTRKFLALVPNGLAIPGNYGPSADEG